MNIYGKLAAIQQELKAPKDKKNTYGGYNYRSAEGILEALKPVLARHEATVVLTDELVQVGDRYYVKATAALWSTTDTDVVTANGWAREAEVKKGMGDSQITGTASSYARKYALNALLLIDDTKDADTDEYRKETEERKKAEKITADQKKTILALADLARVDLGKALGGEDMNKLSASRADQLIAALKEKANGSKG